jgi:hypothetical protein
MRNVSRRISFRAAGAFSGDKVPPMYRRPGSLGVNEEALTESTSPFPSLTPR